MNIDDRGRRAANDMRNSRKEAEFTVKSPSQKEHGPAVWPMLATAVVAIVALIGLVRLIGPEPDTVIGTGTTTTPVQTTIPATTTPATTIPPTTTAVTTTPPTTSQASTTTTPSTGPLPDRALAQSGNDIVEVDPTTGEITVVHQQFFEASWANRLALSPDGSRAYYQYGVEDNWFSCESVAGEVTMMEVASGETTTVAPGLPALSPDGQRLAYLGVDGDGCLPDPTNPAFFIPAYDVLVVADSEGNTLLRFPLGGGVESAGEALRNLVWLDDTTVLVTDGGGTHYRVPTDVDSASPIHDHETLDLADIDLFAVVGSRGVGARFDPMTGYGPLQIVDLGTGEVTPISGEPHGAVGVSSDGVIIIAAHTPSAQLLIDVDLETGEPAQVFDLSETISTIDW